MSFLIISLTKITNTVMLDSVVFAILSTFIGLPLKSRMNQLLLSFAPSTFYILLQTTVQTVICSSTNFFLTSNLADFIIVGTSRLSDENRRMITSSNCSGSVGDAITLGLLCNVPVPQRRVKFDRVVKNPVPSAGDSLETS